MSEDALIRLHNLQATKVDAKQLVAAGIGRYSYCRDLLAGEKSFGEKIARKIEEKLNWPRGCLDKDDGCELVHGVQGETDIGKRFPVSNTEALVQSIPISMPYSPANLSSVILLLGSLVGALDLRSRKVLSVLLTELTESPDDAQDVANKASALASTQKAIVKDKALNEALTRPDAPETDLQDLDHKRSK